MNKLVLLAVTLCALCYFGGNYCPAVLKKNKKMLLGGSIVLLLCSFIGLEGITGGVIAPTLFGHTGLTPGEPGYGENDKVRGGAH